MPESPINDIVIVPGEILRIDPQKQYGKIIVERGGILVFPKGAGLHSTNIQSVVAADECDLVFE